MQYSEVKAAIIVSTLMFLLLIAGVIITLFIANRRNERQELRMVHMQVNYEKELRKVQFEVQEQVLVNVGRELHDNIGQLLTVMNMQLEQHKYLNPESSVLIPQIGNTLSDTITEVRRLGKTLNSDLFETLGLIEAVEQEVVRLRLLKKYEVEWEYDMEPQLTKDQKVIVFRIFQELLNNTMKHAGGKSLQVSLSGNNGFELVVTDDGKGFDLAATMQSAKGSGLRNMTKRAELAKLTCKINSVIGKGTTFTLQNNKPEHA
jgi:two-component system NarL family sensor kinase